MSTRPADSLNDDIRTVLREVADARGVSVDSLTALELQSIGYGFRVAADLEGGSRRMLSLADAVDELSTLDKEAILYLEELARTPLESG
jgi:hypothetical protein